MSNTYVGLELTTEDAEILLNRIDNTLVHTTPMEELLPLKRLRDELRSGLSESYTK